MSFRGLRKIKTNGDMRWVFLREYVYMDEKTFAQLTEQNEEESEVIEFMEKVEATSRLA